MWLEQCPFIQQIFAHDWLCVDTVLGTRDLMMLNKLENAEASTSFHSRRREKQITQDPVHATRATVEASSTL